VIRVLYTNGCSFTAGTELEQEDPGISRNGADSAETQLRITAHRQHWSWPNQLGKLLGADTVVNEARGGASNARAVRMAIDYVCAFLREARPAEELMVCLGFTDLARNERFETAVAGADGVAARGSWELLKPRLERRWHGADWRARRINRLYYRYIFSYEQAVIGYLHQLLNLQFMLSSLGVRFYFHDALATNAPLIAQLQPETNRLLQQVRQGTHRSICHLIGSQTAFQAGLSFEEWSLRSGVPLGSGGHPLSEGHRQWASLLFSEIEKGSQP
jgi:Family of unknown function (DUF6071)